MNELIFLKGQIFFVKRRKYGNRTGHSLDGEGLFNTVAPLAHHILAS